MNARLLTVKDAAAYLSMSEQALYQLVHRGRIPVVRFGRALRFDLDSLNNWIQSHLVSA